MEELKITKEVNMGLEVKKLMRDNHMNNVGLAQRMGVGKGVVTGLLKRKDLDGEQVRKMSEVFGKNLFALYFNEKPLAEQDLQEEIEKLKKQLEEKDKKMGEQDFELKVLRDMMEVIKAMGKTKK